MPHLDSAGLGEIIRCFRALRRSGGNFKLLSPNRRIVDLLTITKLLDVFDTYDNECCRCKFFLKVAIPALLEPEFEYVPAASFLYGSCRISHRIVFCFWRLFCPVGSKLRVGTWELAHALGMESLGRDLSGEMERCYDFMNRATGPRLPRKIVIIASWDQTINSCDQEDDVITVGMNQPAAAADPGAFLLHGAGREMARLGLLETSGGTRRDDAEFLFEGMIEILIHEYDHTSRGLDGAWVIAKDLDDMKLLGMTTQRSWSTFSAGKRCFRTAAPGITLLTTYRELLGREAPLRFFEALKKNSLAASLSLAFRAPATEVESVWLKKVREHQDVDEVTIKAEDAPQLLKTILNPGIAKPGTTIAMQLFLKNRKNNLLPEGVFVRDERSGKVLQGETASEKGLNYLLVKIPVEPNCLPGQYKYQVTAIDETGNLRRWAGSYKVIG